MKAKDFIQLQEWFLKVTLLGERMKNIIPKKQPLISWTAEEEDKQ